jgi:hypothetical protein
LISSSSRCTTEGGREAHLIAAGERNRIAFFYTLYVLPGTVDHILSVADTDMTYVLAAYFAKGIDVILCSDRIRDGRRRPW